MCIILFYQNVRDRTVNFLTDDFLLKNDTARVLFHEYAKDMPIFDYHCHLPPQQIAEDYQFKNLYDIWLKGDHYKWRAMRAHGVDEAFCTGDADDFAKFMEYAKTVPFTIGNPLYHWTHLELRRPFGITDRVLNTKTAQSIWDECNEKLAQKDFSARGILTQMNVHMVGTTDDPIDDLAAHAKVQAEQKNNPALSFKTKVLPSFRPDRVYNIHQDTFNEYLRKLSTASQIEITNFKTLCNALNQRLDHFAAHGCVASDHALDTVVYADSTTAEIDQILRKKANNETLNDHEVAQFKSAVLVFLGCQYADRGWVQQYHIGALRNNNRRMFELKGPDIGFDSINDGLMAAALSQLLSAQDLQNKLPKTILYCLNPRDNEVLGTMIGNFQGQLTNGASGKMQFGSGWWFNDQKDGMERQMMQLAQLGLLSHFVGMLTDSRSFLSFTRHEYFRRILCQMIGQWVTDGEAPNDIELLGNMVKNISFNNAQRYFEL